MTKEELDAIIVELWGRTPSLKEAILNEPKETEGEKCARLAYEAQQQRKKYEAEEKRYLDVLKALANDKTTEFGAYMFLKSPRKGSIDYKMVPELLGLDLEPYRNVDATVWQLIKKD